MSAGLRARVITGVRWTALSQIGRQVFSFGFFIVLAHFLGPNEYGLLALVLVFSNFAALIADPGFGAALIQKEILEERHRSSVFWANLALGLGLTALFALAAPLVARFYDEPALVWLTIAMGLHFAISPCELIQQSLLTRALAFKQLAAAELSATIISGVCGIGLAVSGFGVWSLVAMSLTRALASAVILWSVSDWRPRRLLQRAALQELLGFSAGLFGFKLVNYWLRKADDLLIGKLMSPGELGLYSRAYSIMLMPLDQVTGTIGRVLFPALSSVQDDLPRVRRIYLDAVAMIAFATAPLTFGLLAVSENFVLGVLGDRWAGMILVLQIFCPLGFVQSLVSSLGWIVQARGRTDILFRWGLGAGVVIIAGIVTGVMLGSIETVALGYSVAAGIILVYPAFRIIGGLIGIRFFDVVRAVAGSLIAALLMAGAVYALDRFLLADHLGRIARLSIQVPIGVGLYALFARIIAPRAWHAARALV